VSEDLTIIIPTYNEKENIYHIYDLIKKAVTNINWEIIVVDDDSPDGTSSIVREIEENDRRVRCIQRLDRRGLSSACIEGILASSSPVICIMDADLQHDEKIIPDMYSALLEHDLELVVGSRYIGSGSTGTMPRYRVLVSKFATLIGGFVMKQSVSDPMSGFFMLRRDFFEKVMRNLSGRGFKILLDILISTDRAIKVREVPYVMRERAQGESKLSAQVIWEFFILIMDKFFGRILPIRFISFVTIGFSGVFVHLLVLGILHKILNIQFIYAQALATLVAMTSNFILNNHFTYQDKKLQGKQFIRGLFSFYIACSIGAVINVALAELLYELSFFWWLAGMLGAIAGAVWNYALTATFTWSKYKNG